MKTMAGCSKQWMGHQTFISPSLSPNVTLSKHPEDYACVKCVLLNMVPVLYSNHIPYKFRNLIHSTSVSTNHHQKLSVKKMLTNLLRHNLSLLLQLQRNQLTPFG